MFCPIAHAAHISHCINPWCFSAHGKISVLCAKVTLHFSFTLHSPSFFSLDLFSPTLSLNMCDVIEAPGFHGDANI